METIITTRSGNTYHLRSDNYIEAEQPRRPNPYSTESPVKVEGVLLSGEPKIGSSMKIYTERFGHWYTSAVTGIIRA